MFWTKKTQYRSFPFALEKDLEIAIQEVKVELFGANRIYLETKRKIGKKGEGQNIPDAYLLDLTSKTTPKLFVVEVELGYHHPTKHIAVQLLEFSLSFELSRQQIKGILKEEINKSESDKNKVETYAKENGFENLDYLLEKIVHQEKAFNALVIIDETSDRLEAALQKQFRFPVDIIPLSRFKNNHGEVAYNFDPFLSELIPFEPSSDSASLSPDQINCIVIAAQEEGFEKVFIGENRWWQIRISATMIDKIKWIAAYQTAPISAITHVAKVHSIELWDGGPKYVVNFEGPANKIKPLKLNPMGKVLAPQAPRYTNIELIDSAQDLDDAFENFHGKK